MSGRVIGISGSPVPNSNTDRAIRAILEGTGMAASFVKLADHRLEPCRACLGCTESNECVVEDDGPDLAERFREADAFVIGGYTPYSSLDARTKCFMERMYCLRHRTGLNAGKIGVSVITSACAPGAANLPPAAETALNQIAFWMMEEGMENLGSMVLLGNVPCIRCGHGDDCPMSGIAMIHGSGATVASVGVRRFEEDRGLVARAGQLGEMIAEAVGKKRRGASGAERPGGR